MCSASIETSHAAGARRGLPRWLQRLKGRQGATGTAVAALLLGLALFLRLRGLDTTGIWNDQAFTLGTAMRWVNGGDMPLAANISSLGFFNPPMIEYVYAAALWVWPDILSVAVLTLISGIIAVAAAGWATLRVFGRSAAFWTVLVFVVNPWSVYYSQLIWNQTMVPVFASLTFACLLLYFAGQQRPVYLILSFVWAACMTQVHPGSSVQLLTMGLIILIFWRRLRLWPVVAGITLFSLLYAPYLLFEQGVGWRDLDVIADLMGMPAQVSNASILVSFDLLQAQALLSDVPGVSSFDDLASALLIAGIAITGLIGVGTAMQREAGDDEKQSRLVGVAILVLWFVVPILFYLRSSDLVYVQPYYLIGQLPAHFVFVGVALATVQNRLFSLSYRAGACRRSLALASAFWLVPALPLLVLLAWQFSFNLQFQEARFENRPPEAQIRQIRSAVETGNRVLSLNPACVLVVVSEGHSVEQSYLSLIREFTVPDRVLLADGRLGVPIPSRCAYYLDALSGSRASTWLEQQAGLLPSSEIEAPTATWRFFALDDADGESFAGRSDRDSIAQWENGVGLRQYERTPLEPGGSLALTLVWLVESSPPEQVYHVGTYLLDMNNQLIAQHDGPGFDSIQWRRGDSFITWADIPIPQDLPPGDYRLGVAYYTWPAIERVALRSGGNTAFLEQLQYP